MTTSSSTLPTSFQLAILALPDKPMRARVTHVAHPLDERGVGFYQLEDVCAVGKCCHCGGLVGV